MRSLNQYFIPLLLLIFFFFCSCKKEKDISVLVTFDVGFEDLKNFQGICENKGEEEVYFYKSKFNPIVKFYDLAGNPKDSFSLQQVENKIGRIGLFTVISRDTMLAVSYQTEQMAGLRSDGSLMFKINLDSLSGLTEENRYSFWGNCTPTPIHIGNNVIFILMWGGKHRNEYRATSQLDYYKHVLESRMHSPILCKVESVFGSSPQIKYGLRNHYYNKSPELKSYGFCEKDYAILNNKLFLILANDRNVYELDLNTLNVIDTIPVVPQEYKIPSGIKLIDKPGISEDNLAEQELMDKCRITNMLYSNAKKQYYVFLKTGKDLSVVDELGYRFKLYVYDDGFTKKKEYSFNTDDYNPKTAMMTSKGIMIEKMNKQQEYGKKTFEFMDL